MLGNFYSRAGACENHLALEARAFPSSAVPTIGEIEFAVNHDLCRGS